MMLYFLSRKNNIRGRIFWHSRIINLCVVSWPCHEIQKKCCRFEQKKSIPEISSCRAEMTLTFHIIIGLRNTQQRERQHYKNSCCFLFCAWSLNNHLENVTNNKSDKKNLALSLSQQVYYFVIPSRSWSAQLLLIFFVVSYCACEMMMIIFCLFQWQQSRKLPIKCSPAFIFRLVLLYFSFCFSQQVAYP